jgi:hypothetical protein
MNASDRTRNANARKPANDSYQHRSRSVATGALQKRSRVAQITKQKGLSGRLTQINKDQSRELPLLDAFMRLYYYAR